MRRPHYQEQVLDITNTLAFHDIIIGGHRRVRTIDFDTGEYQDLIVVRMDEDTIRSMDAVSICIKYDLPLISYNLRGEMRESGHGIFPGPLEPYLIFRYDSGDREPKPAPDASPEASGINESDAL